MARCESETRNVQMGNYLLEIKTANGTPIVKPFVKQ